VLRVPHLVIRWSLVAASAAKEREALSRVIFFFLSHKNH
jgi:hypothetical protein